MKLKAAVAISVAIHISLFAIAIYIPGNGSHKAPTTYYVDLFAMPGNGSGGGGKGEPPPLPSQNQRMKDLTAKKEDPQSQLRYPDENVKQSKKKKEEPKKKELITIVKNETKQKPKDSGPTIGVSNLPGNVLKTGISSGTGGSGGGTGGGIGSGSGGKYGSGSGLGGFPYAYYIEMIRSRISSSWYNALVSPGVRGRYVASVFFKILRNGQTRDLALEGKSGNDSLDLSALRAIENASPFPPLPGDYPDTSLIVHFEFEWEKK